jgi:hypothetical protein
MKLTREEPVVGRLRQLFEEVCTFEPLHYHDRLREFVEYCERTAPLATVLAELPEAHFDSAVDWREWEERWPSGDAGYAFRWDAIKQAVASGSSDFIVLRLLLSKYPQESLEKFTSIFVYPVFDHLVHQIEDSTGMLYTLLRYKRWAEWFEADKLREIYKAFGEAGLDRNLRRFLFESGVDYPYSEPHSPGGRADIVAELHTDDPLVLEIKVWDSDKRYREDRVRDGLRQVIDYADKYGKDRGYVAVFNLDREPLAFVSDPGTQDWPSRLEHGGKTYYFIPIEIAEQAEPVSQRARGKPVEVNEVRLAELWADGNAQEA